jgi:hypothetical protein
VPLAEEDVRSFVLPALDEAGFSRLGRSSVWRREPGDLVHLLQFQVRAARLRVQWGVLSLDVLDALWPDLPPSAGSDVAYSVMTGWLTSIPGTTSPVDVEMPAATSEKEARLAPLSQDLRVAASWLRSFQRRPDVVDYLLAVQDPKDRRGFLVPSNLPLKLASCAFLLHADGATTAPAMAQRALDAMPTPKSTSDPVVAHRRRTLAVVAAAGGSE